MNSMIKTPDKNCEIIDRKVSIAPMMSWTDKHYRYFMRLISPNTLLYTVMVTTGALVYGKKYEILEFNKEEHPVALQLGGSDPKDLAYCSKLGEEYGYDEINLNCGCPSDRVQRGKIGACLMTEPEIVAECIDAMMQAVNIPVTIKNRIGIDDFESYEFLTDFIGKTSEKGCNTFIVHARKAILDGLSPSENRSIPPLKWDVVYKLKKDFPHLNIVLNGGISEIAHIKEALEHTDGVMIGREAYKNPYLFAEIEKEVFGNSTPLSRDEVVDKMLPYIENHLKQGLPLKDISRHILGLYHGCKGGKKWRQILSEEAYGDNAGVEVIKEALKYTTTIL